MAVAPSLITRHPQISDWSTEPRLNSYKSSSDTMEKGQNVLKNSAELVKQQSDSFYQPVIFGFIIGVLFGGIALATVVTLWLTASTTTTTTATTTALPIVVALWNFDNNTNDQYNNYNGTSVNTPTYTTGYTNLSYTALSFSAVTSQYVKIAYPFLNLTYRSFTVEIWFYPTILSSGSYGLFGQCQTTSMDLCLMFLIRNYTVYLGFLSDDLAGVTTLSINKWYHVAFVYDYSISSQLIYLNGVLEANRSSNPYQGMAGPILIGAIDNGTKYYFTGNIDQISLITRAKNVTEILNDATLVCYYSFDSNLYSDSGPLNLIGTGVNVANAFGNGRVNDAISFPSAPSYFVVGGLTRLGTPGQPYSISIWINPTSVNGGTIAHVTRCNYNCTSFWCLAFIGLTLGGQIAIQSWSNIINNTLVSLTGPVLSINVWTHIVQTYSPNNGMCLYVNGLLSNQSNTFQYSASNLPDYIYLGMFPLHVCVSKNVIAMGQYYGLLDEFRLFSREITASEVYVLANP